jgi:cytochrome c-type biogenesis protein CcmF
MFITGEDILFVAGLVSLIVAACGLCGGEKNDAFLFRLTRIGSAAVFMLCLASFVWLVMAFIQSDFSYQIVYRNSHTDKPLFYKLAGAWGNHEGSMLLWALIASLYGAFFALWPARFSAFFARRTLGVQAVLVTGFIAYVVFVSNPFARFPIAPEQGLGLNPLLQDPALSFHPPMLYMGYVGFSIIFSLAVAGLLTRLITRDWAATLRRWVLFAWSALTVGITLGSWWAYYELGWGGWWFWDPVENASLVPWLAATALLHSIIVVEKRGSLKAWSVLLALLTFSFCLIGTFLVRSGIITSVHSFALDPERGLSILLLIGGLSGWGLLLFALRAQELEPDSHFAPLSRESLLVINNIFLFTASLTVLIGTVYPLLFDLMTGTALSVGPPYYESTFTPLMMPLMLLMGFAPFALWQRDTLERLLPQLKAAGLTALAGILLAFMLTDGAALRFILGLAFAGWIAGSTLFHAAKTKKLAPMTLAHVGLAVALTGMVISSHFSIDKVMLMKPGQELQLGQNFYRFTGISNETGPNYLAERAAFEVRGTRGTIATLYPERRLYPVAGKILSEVAIHTNGLRDLYLVLGEAQKGKDGNYMGWSVHARENPAIPLLWLGCLLMAAAGIMALLGKRKSALDAA